MISIQHAEFKNMDKVYRLNLINCLSGFKSANLLGTKGSSGQENLAVFSSVIHIGSNPPLLGFITRPLHVPRHTYKNIKETGKFTINHIHHSFTAEAHQTSAKYDADVSEFEACGLTPEYLGDFSAPFVQESNVKLAMRFVEEHFIPANDTVLVIGEIEAIYIPENGVAEDGWVDLDALGTAAISGLNAYHKPSQIQRYEYARPKQDLKIIS